ncbi:MAG TPA: hypothetical protein VMH27_03940 [Puia sp.]|nr:hypothetical protein [Puia sp.]
MVSSFRLLRYAVTILLLLVADYCRPCSMFKITVFGKTLVGNNEDAWRVNSRIWFESGSNGHYGAAYVGHDDWWPQGGINEKGLVYDGFAVYRRTLHPAPGKKPMGSDFGNFLKTILQQCASVQEVRDFVSRFERSRMNGSMLLFVDKSGEYLVVEADTTILGHDEKYVLANFCPSLTKPEDVQIGRYKRGRAFLQNKEDTSLAFCTAMMDTMHECRRRLGDGTTYTTIYDLKDKLIYLYFYHDYSKCITFNLDQELSKGNHAFLMTDLFPPNPEYIRFTKFKTPFNDVRMRLTLTLLFFFLVLSLPVFAVIFLKKRAPIWLALLIINLGLAWDAFNLSDNIAIYYFNRPYREEGRWLLNLSSWFPLALLILFIPIVIATIRYIRKKPNKFHLLLLSANALSYAILLGLLIYWDLIF